MVNVTRLIDHIHMQRLASTDRPNTELTTGLSRSVINQRLIQINETASVETEYTDGTFSPT
jgi:hypothetical protein